MNKHLTLQELKVLNKVPIWVEDTEYPKNSGWHIIEWNNRKYLCLMGLSSKGYTVEEYGESWFAYRFNPHEDSIEKDYTPVLRCRTEKYERYEECGVNQNGETIYLKRVFVDEKSYAMYCPKCGKRLCSRFTNFCPNCGVRMKG